jgi:hypothetical protein
VKLVIPSWVSPPAPWNGRGARDVLPPPGGGGRRRSPRAWCEGTSTLTRSERSQVAQPGGVTPQTSSASSSLPRAGARALSIYAGSAQLWTRHPVPCQAAPGFGLPAVVSALDAPDCALGCAESYEAPSAVGVKEFRPGAFS